MRSKVAALVLSVVVAAASSAAAPVPAAAAPIDSAQIGIDVSVWQGDIDWAAVAGAGIDFAYAKATEGSKAADGTDGFSDDKFERNSEGAKANGILFGGYAFARPDKQDARAQADWLLEVMARTPIPDGLRLPPMLDIEWPYFDTVDACYNLSPDAMVAWISDFVDQIRVRTGQPTMIYTVASWWNQCTGSSTKFGANPLFVARWANVPGPLPAGWSNWTIWQYTDSGRVPGVAGPVDRNYRGNAPYATLPRG